MSRSIDATVWERWRDRHRRFESSDLTVAAYCQAEGVSQAGFYLWRKKLRAGSAPTVRRVKPTSTKPTSTKPASMKPTSTKPTSTKPTSTKPTSMKPTSMKPTSTKPASTKPTFVPVVATSVASAVVVTLRNGVRVEVPAVDHELVGHVVLVAATTAAAGGDS